MESEIRGEFQCVVRFVLGKPFSGAVAERVAGIEVDDEHDEPSIVDREASQSARVCVLGLFQLINPLSTVIAFRQNRLRASSLL